MTTLRHRDAFGYMEPEGTAPDFAQCSSCRLWIEPRKRCWWLPDDKEVVAGASCIMYVEGPPIADPEAKATGALTPEEVGFYVGKTRCENCTSLIPKENKCGMYADLNEKMPEVFELEEKVKAKACCNAFASPEASAKEPAKRKWYKEK